jgi:type III secretion protein SpaR/YscT/HrcT
MFGISDAQSYLDKYGLHVDLFRYLLVGGLIFTRIFIMSMFLPYLGTKPIPGRIRVAVCVALAIFFYFPVSAMTTAALPTSGAALFALFFKEALFGILLGFSAGLVFYGIQAAGNVIDNQRMLANAQIFNPGIGSQASLFGIFYYQLAIVIFLIIGGHHHLFQALAKSFEAVPLLETPEFGANYVPVIALVMRLTADVLVISVQLGAPVVIAILLSDIILGLMNRVAPMINVFEMGFNIKGYMGVLMVYLSLPLVFQQMKFWFTHYMETVSKIIDLFIR